MKVVKVENPTKVAAGKTKQDTVIADATGTFRVTSYLSFPVDGNGKQTTDVDTGRVQYFTRSTETYI